MAEHRPLTRRDLLRFAAASGVAAAVGSHADRGGPPPAAAQVQHPRTPEEAIARLSAGNNRYATAQQTMTMLRDDMQTIRGGTRTAQFPFAAVLACADSRIPPEIAFDQTIGQLFVVRVAGNIVTPDSMASLEYAVHVLTRPPTGGEPTVKVIVVLGHGNCGAVSAAASGAVVPGQISALYPPIRAAIGQSTGDVAIKTNTRAQAALLTASSSVIRNRVMTGNLQVVAWYYDVASGLVSAA